MTSPMPKDNEVDEKAVAFAMTDHQDDGPMTILTTDRKYAECWAADRDVFVFCQHAHCFSD